jgi:hypothetical protein
MQHPTADQRGTEQSPLVVKIAPATKSEAEVTEERRERDEKSANDRETILFNGYLVTIGAAQLFVFIALLGSSDGRRADYDRRLKRHPISPKR